MYTGGMIDTHAHLFAEEFAGEREVVMERARCAGVEAVLMPNIDVTTVKPMLETCGMFPGYCYPMIGLHPTSVDAGYKQSLARLREWLEEEERFIAIGEIGLDLYWDKAYLVEQLDAFEIQIGWALEYGLPIAVHSREAYTYLYNIVSKYRATELRGVFHSFTGSAEEAHALLEHDGFYLGINGVVTFKNSSLSNALKEVPLERILLETDAPYLAPVPYRGKRNESSYLNLIADRLAKVYETSSDVVKMQTKENAKRLFGL